MICQVHSQIVAKKFIVNRKVVKKKIGKTGSDAELTTFLTGVSERTVQRAGGGRDELEMEG
jgi:predicted regulator of amino acid metabolism with ACT domain